MEKDDRIIPPVLYQIWHDWGHRYPPKRLQENTDQWKKLHPSWEYVLFDEKMSEEFISQHMPETLRIYRAMPKGIQKCDFIRIIILYVKGGVYADFDCVPLRNMDELRKTSLVLVSSSKTNMNHLSNYFIMSSPRNPFIKCLIDDITTNHRTTPKGIELFLPHLLVMNTTGPLMWWRVAKSNPELLASANILRRSLTTSSLPFPLNTFGGQIHKDQLMDHSYEGAWVSIDPATILIPALFIVTIMLIIATLIALKDKGLL
jgi:mannosyltransferase OCH1-like enzyme